MPKITSRSTIKINLPSVVFGTSSLGNLYVALSDEIKLNIVKECISHTNGQVVFDSAGKYGAGLALESLGKCLTALDVDQKDVLISNKLGWLRTALTTPEPTFEPGVWKELKYDAVQCINYDGIMQCFEQGNQLLKNYIPQLVSVHDPDEYLAKAHSEVEKKKLYDDILDAYRALADLKASGQVKAIGIGSKDWRVIEMIAGDVKLDWVMFANSMTIKSHPGELLTFMKKLNKDGVQIINSAVFHSGFLIGGDFYDYKKVCAGTAKDDELLQWRDDFFKLCSKYQIKPAEACVQFALKAPGVESIALNTSNPNRVEDNVKMANALIPVEFWDEMVLKGMIDKLFFEEFIC
ncbi:aldo/keto reductase [Mucilaginibacter sp. FT3.2]|uniref:aldo/keto reductase n=1 Tax=Mucilaginibacter sp. FT3.2 TaxID=2723090 RepID=UPI0016214156|nr:aldo/keto reductase [Mucilaginibacter sp. FT3.2]MBB6230386.1 D-threo-aldose 1-dehydrogenase [Mucilaginibacter sp. FT3.2]